MYKVSDTNPVQEKLSHEFITVHLVFVQGAHVVGDDVVRVVGDVGI